MGEARGNLCGRGPYCPAPSLTDSRMLAHLAVLLLQGSTLPSPAASPQSRDSVRAAAARRTRDERAPKRDSVTAHHLATAFSGAAAREILALARRARATQDSALQSYDATTYQRISVGLGLSRFGLERLAFRSEASTHVHWRRGVGAYVDVTGSRSVMPIAGRSARVSIDGQLSPIPYYPGSETLWIGLGTLSNEVDEHKGIVHPLAIGAEAYFTYEAGDSVSFRLPDGRRIQLRELRVRPRQPKWNLAVGSLWFDMSGGQLVRAAYRMSSPMDIARVAQEDDSSAFDDVPVWVKPMLFPMTAQVGAIGVEYGLYQGRFWLPRLQVVEGGGRVGPMRAPFRIEQRFDYADVNTGAPLPPIPAATDSSRRFGQGVTIDVGSPHVPTARDSARARTEARCDASGMRGYRRSGDTLNPVFVRIPCDSAKLASSPELPASIYDTGDEVVNRDELDALVRQALSMGAQADFAPQLPVVDYLTPRYNRVEGVSVGGRADQELGAGYSAHALARIGLADRQPVVELSAARSDMRRTLALTAYNRLLPASDYGNPFGLGSSLSALLFSRDEAYYYRASGVELTSTPEVSRGGAWTWGLFAEHERSAPRRTTFALSRGVTGFGFDTNLVAARGVFYGARTRMRSTFGLNPEGARLFTDLSAEAAHGDTGSFLRVAADAKVSHPVAGGAASLTLAGGTSVGTLPLQRNWFLGGSQTVRGQRAALEPGRMGNAFWLARAELARGAGVIRPIVFADMGWAGDRAHLGDMGRPLSGAGVGASVLDGLLRFDVARGIHPDRAWRVYTYLESRF